MLKQEALTKLEEFLYEIPKELRADMRVPARIYSNEALLEPMLLDETIMQLCNVATLPGVTGFVYGMPDMHVGYGFPVGGVAATKMPDGVVSPGGVGFDINCGVRLLTLPFYNKDLDKDKQTALVHELSRSIAVGLGSRGGLEITEEELERVLEEGSPFLVRSMGHGLDADIEHTEANGCLAGADPSHVSDRAKQRGIGQLGTMGSGNHFVEVQEVETIFDEDAAKAMGIEKGQVTVLIHSGSRGLGHQVCTDYVRIMDRKVANFGISLPDRQLSCAPASSEEGKNYLAAMACAANFAWSNRQAMGHAVRGAVNRLFPGSKPEDVRVVYDVAHNIAKMETHDGELVCVHRKGATRAFGPSNPETPAAYRAVGQPVFIPGSMGTSSYVLAGLDTLENRSWGSTCHGAGRALSRTAAKKKMTGAELRQQLEAQRIIVRCPSNQGLAEEAPFAYKDVDDVTAVVEQAGLAKRVARLRPFGIIKG